MVLYIQVERAEKKGQQCWPCEKATRRNHPASSNMGRLTNHLRSRMKVRHRDGEKHSRESQGTLGFMSSTLIPVKHPDFCRHSRPFQARSQVRCPCQKPFSRT